jgi:cell wall-associated NlpC family hydrolase
MWANSYVGLPFRDPGFMCGDLVKKVLLQRFGLVVADDPVGDDIEAHIEVLRANGQWIEVECPRPGDVVLMNTPVGRGEVAPIHVGIMATSTRVLHVDRGKLSTCQSLSDPDIRSRLAGFYRHTLMSP